jgi:hypothetical protein
MKKRALKELRPPPFPQQLKYVWEMFLDMHKGRGEGFSGPTALTWEAIAAWCNLTDTVLSSTELRIIKTLDRVWLETMRESDNG